MSYICHFINNKLHPTLWTHFQQVGPSKDRPYHVNGLGGLILPLVVVPLIIVALSVGSVVAEPPFTDQPLDLIP